MAKDPAFLFYPGDWLGGTMGMTFEMKGCYFELLVFQFHNNGKFTEAQAKQVLNGSFEVAWPSLKQKFANEDNCYFNVRLNLEIEKRKRFTDSRKTNGLQPKKQKEEIEASAKHIENENINENKDIIKVENKGGVGEMWDSVKKRWLQDFRYKEKICMDKNIGLPTIETRMNEFISEIELKEDYKDIAALKKHFINWNNKRYNGSTANWRHSATNNTKLGTSDARTKKASEW